MDKDFGFKKTKKNKKKKQKQTTKTILSLVQKSSDLASLFMDITFSANGLGGMLAHVLAYQYFTVLVP
jgi:hypothetical protein